jgi:2Fe-2S ferredoxin
MPVVTYVDPLGAVRAVEVPSGMSVMDGALNSGIAGILAECGGNLACATCHVYVDAHWLERVAAQRVSEAEEEMLDYVSADRGAGSRLACQLTVDESLDGLVVRVAPEQV